ncbi:nucleotidyltransferase [Synergistales bacterium]|nr:nucleotidyltransferase [Synergistales bacterium]
MEDTRGNIGTVERFSVPESFTVLQCIQSFNDADAKILLVADGERRVTGIVTNGDIRRGIYRNVPFSSPIGDICNRNFKFLRGRADEESAALAAIALHEEFDVLCVPVLDDEGRASDIIFVRDLLPAIDKRMGNKVVIMAGGRGSRLDPITKIVPKPLLPIGNRPIIELIMDSFKEQGLDKFIISVNYKKDYIKGYFAESDKAYDIGYCEENRFMGTAGSLSLMRDSLRETFFLTNCDIMVAMNYRSAYREHVRQGSAVTIVGVLKNFTVPYGVIRIKEGEFSGMEEKPDFHFMVNSGIYIIEPECLDLIDFSASPDGMFHMTRLIDAAVARGMGVGVYPVHKKWIDIGQWDEYNKVL